MPIIYQCRHCGQHVGEIAAQEVDAAMLGLQTLSEAEQKEMVQKKQNGDIHIQTICHSCESTLKAHPQYHELDHFIH